MVLGYGSSIKLIEVTKDISRKVWVPPLLCWVLFPHFCRNRFFLDAGGAMRVWGRKVCNGRTPWCEVGAAGRGGEVSYKVSRKETSAKDS